SQLALGDPAVATETFARFNSLPRDSWRDATSPKPAAGGGRRGSQVAVQLGGAPARAGGPPTDRTDRAEQRSAREPLADGARPRPRASAARAREGVPLRTTTTSPASATRSGALGRPLRALRCGLGSSGSISAHSPSSTSRRGISPVPNKNYANLHASSAARLDN